MEIQPYLDFLQVCRDQTNNANGKQREHETVYINSKSVQVLSAASPNLPKQIKDLDYIKTANIIFGNMLCDRPKTDKQPKTNCRQIISESHKTQIITLKEKCVICLINLWLIVLSAC